RRPRGCPLPPMPERRGAGGERGGTTGSSPTTPSGDEESGSRSDDRKPRGCLLCGRLIPGALRRRLDAVHGDVRGGYLPVRLTEEVLPGAGDVPAPGGGGGDGVGDAGVVHHGKSDILSPDEDAVVRVVGPR